MFFFVVSCSFVAYSRALPTLASVSAGLGCFVVVSFEGRAFRLYVHALNPSPSHHHPSSPHHHTYSFIDDLYTPISQSLHPHHLTPTTNLLHLPPHSTSLCCMHCDILQAARLNKARAELGFSGGDQIILKAINGGDLEAKDGYVRDEWGGGVTYI